MKLKRRAMKRGRVEIIPMIDTILILLIFYMSFSTFAAREKRLDACLPLKGPGIDDIINLAVHVRSEREVVVNDVPFDLASFRASLATVRSASERVNVVIDADAGVSYQAIVNVMDACAQAKLTHVAFRPLS